jgi:hypothetical protein
MNTKTRMMIKVVCKCKKTRLWDKLSEAPATCWECGSNERTYSKVETKDSIVPGIQLP